MNKSTFSLLLAPVIQKHRTLIIIASLMLLIGTSAEVAGPYLVKHYIDEYLVQENFQLSIAALLAVTYILLLAIAAGFRYLQSVLFANIALDSIAQLRRRVFSHVLSLPTSWHDQSISGQTLSRITNDTESLKELYVDFVGTAISNCVLLIGILIGMAILDVYLMLIALCMIPIVITLVVLYQRISGPAVAKIREKRAEQNVHISEAINGMTVLQSMNQTERYAKQFAQINDEQYLARMALVKASGLFLRPAMDLISTTILAGVILLFGYKVIGGEAQIGVLYAFILYLGRFTEPLVEMTQRYSVFQSAMVAGERVNTLLQVKPQTYGDDDDPVLQADIQIQNLNFAYKPNEPVLQNINVELPAGKFLAVVGRTGSGKSTLLNLLLGHYPVSGSQITLDNRPLNQLSEICRTQAIGLVPQDPFIKVGSLKDNLIMERDIPELALQQAIIDAQLLPLIDSLPHGIDTLLGEGGTNLSTGQRQLVAMARALAGRPQILLLDEATASLDSQTEIWVQQALLRLKGRVSLVVVAHRLSTIRDADEILVLNKGTVIERGSHRALLDKPGGYYAKLHEYQQQEQVLESE